MRKVLSIIVPTYNMADLLPRCLDSIVDSEVMDKLDVLVVNDGSTDLSWEIALSYSEKFPQSIRVIDKVNGNYGSAINTALPLAAGKYVKILDADDLFDSAALKCYVAELDGFESMVDISVTHFHVVSDGVISETLKYNNYGREPYVYGKVYHLDEVLGGGYIRYFLMHSLTYRTQMLRENGYFQSEGISYTDVQWASYPLFWAKTIAFTNLVLYQYNVSRKGQTTDPEVIRNNLPQLEMVTMEQMDYYRHYDRETLSDTRQKFLKQYFKNRIKVLIKTHLIDIPRANFDKKVFCELDKRIQAILSEFEMGTVRIFPDNKIIRVDAYKYWKRHGDRLPVWIESLIHITDIVVKKVFVLLFH